MSELHQAQVIKGGHTTGLQKSDSVKEFLNIIIIIIIVIIIIPKNDDDVVCVSL